MADPLRWGDTATEETDVGSTGGYARDLYHEELGEGIPILLIHPSGATASTWGSVLDELARVGRVITYDRRGYARTGGKPVRSIPSHTADAAALLEDLGAAPAAVVGISSSATIALDLAVRRPDLVRVVIAHEAPWRFTRHIPTTSQVATLVTMGALALVGRYGDAAEALLRSAYSYRDGGSAWDAFPEEWRRTARENARATLTDFLISIGDRPRGTDLARIDVPVVCSYGSRSPRFMLRVTRSLASAIPTARMHRIDGAAHAAPFDATAEFLRLIGEAMTADVAVGAPGPLDGSTTTSALRPTRVTIAVAGSAEGKGEG
jgi:pimeloyl-ACP methyl ester carboxylesterase